MSWKLPCEIVQDLLPSYVDSLTSPVTGEAVRTHLDTCTSCRDCYERMRVPEEQPPPGEREELDFLRRTKRRHRQVVAFSVAAALLVVTAILLVRTFLIGSPLPGNQVNWSESTVKSNELTLRGTVADESRGCSSVDCREEDGVVTVTVNATRRSSFHGAVIQATYTASEEIRQVRVGDQVIWDRGETIIPWVRSVYATRHPYVGDVSANARTAQALGLSDVLGEWSSELQTGKEPFGWTIQIKTEVPAEKQKTWEQYLRSNACVLLAVIDNLGEVRYTYNVDDNPQTLKVTAEEAANFAGQDIKTCGESPRDLQELMGKVKPIA